jgi:hypothetical protein
MKTLLLAGTTVALLAAANLVPAMAQATKPVSQVVQWNKTLLVIVRTPGAQPTTIHPTRSFAIMHGAIYDAVNAIDATHKPYLVRLSASHFASQEAAAAAAAHEVLIKLYPSFQATLDAQLQQSLTQIPNTGKADGVSIGNSVLIGFWPCGTMTARMPSPSPMFSATRRGITNRHRRIFLSNLSSPTGLASLLLPSRAQTSFVQAALRR